MAISLKNLIEDAVDGSFTLMYPDGSTAIKNFRQRSLGYGDNKPLITTDLPGINDDPNKITINGVGTADLSFIDGVTDGFIRGGATLAGIRAVRDTERITKFLLTPEGIAHSAAQVALQRSNPETIISRTNRQWSPLNLLAQIPAAITPLHVRRDGFNLREENRKTYEGEMKALLELNAGEARYDEDTENPKTLISLYDKFINNGFNNSQLGLSLDPNLTPPLRLKQYSGGAGSYFGIGNTAINKVANTNQLFETLKNRQNAPSGSFVEANFSARQSIRRDNQRIRDKYKLGDPGKFDPDLFKYNEDGSINTEDNSYELNNYAKRFSIDQVNASPIINRYNLDETALDEYKDFIKFRFALIDTQDPLRDEVILFRAFLDDYNDNLQGKWTPHQYNGRAEDFYTYSGFGREINFNFKVGAQSEEELLPLYFKLNALMGSTAPEYINRRMRGRYIRITLGDILSDTPGFFNNINITWNPSYVWEIKPDKQLPQVISVNCNFTPIHDFAPQSRKDSPFILTRAALNKAVRESRETANIDRMRNG